MQFLSVHRPMRTSIPPQQQQHKAPPTIKFGDDASLKEWGRAGLVAAAPLVYGAGTGIALHDCVPDGREGSMALGLIGAGVGVLAHREAARRREEEEGKK